MVVADERILPIRLVSAILVAKSYTGGGGIGRIFTWDRRSTFRMSKPRPTNIGRSFKLN